MSQEQATGNGRCHTCRWFVPKNDQRRGRCDNLKKIGEPVDVDTSADDYLSCPYDEGGRVEVGQNFGCVHWEKKKQS